MGRVGADLKVGPYAFTISGVRSSSISTAPVNGS
jgi:hypothetical protein